MLATTAFSSCLQDLSRSLKSVLDMKIGSRFRRTRLFCAYMIVMRNPGAIDIFVLQYPEPYNAIAVQIRGRKRKRLEQSRRRDSLMTCFAGFCARLRAPSSRCA
jgi:hypothetical protein